MTTAVNTSTGPRITVGPRRGFGSKRSASPSVRGTKVQARPARMASRRPMGLGLRLVQLYYLFVLAVGLAYGALINPMGDIGYVYDLSMIRAIVQMSTSAQAVWLLQRRSARSIRFCIISTLVCVSLSVIDIVVLKADLPLFYRLGGIASIAIVVGEYIAAAGVVYYLATSRQAHEVLVLQMDDAPEGPGNSWDVPLRQRVRTWQFWRDLVIYFIVFSFLGHWAEILFCRLILAGVFMGGYDPTNAMLWDQWLFPFSAEGTALAMVVLLLHPLKQHLQRRFDGRVLPALACSFLANAAVCTSIDFITGITCNLDYQLWDYRDMPFNFMGQVCLQNSMVYSIAATLIVWVVYPLMDRGLRRMPRSVTDGLFFGLVGFYAFEAALHFIAIP